jgi:hypothetical protein
MKNESEAEGKTETQKEVLVCMCIHGYVDEFGSCSTCGLFTQNNDFVS